MTNEEFEAMKASFSDDHIIDAAERALAKLCDTGGKSFTMSVPPNIYDTDMLFSELIRRFKASRQAAVTSSSAYDEFVNLNYGRNKR